MDILERMQAHNWAEGDKEIAEAAGNELTRLRHRVFALDQALHLLTDDLGEVRRSFESVRETAGRYLQRARDAEELVRLLQAQISARQGADIDLTKTAEASPTVVEGV